MTQWLGDWYVNQMTLDDPNPSDLVHLTCSCTVLPIAVCGTKIRGIPALDADDSDLCVVCLNTHVCPRCGRYGDRR